MKSLQVIDIVYKNAPDSQKIWVEATNRYWLEGGLKSFKKSLENHVELSKSLADSILNNLPKKPKVVVDIGAGYGGVAVNLALKGFNVTAVEPVKKERDVIAYFLRRFPKAKKNLKIIEGAAENLPIKSNSVDLCVLSQVLEHVEDSDKTMCEIIRVLKPGGYCHISSPNYLFPAEQHYHLPYFPLMSKKLFSKWAIFVLKTMNIRGIKEVKNRDFSLVEEFIDSLNYTTDKLIRSLCSKNNLEIVWSFNDQAGLLTQIKQHYLQNPSLKGVALVSLSMPIKIIRTALIYSGMLPIKLEYIIQKS